MRDNKTQHNFKPGTPIFDGYKNVFITVDGIDGSGKTTVVNILNKIMTEKGYPTKTLRVTQSGKIAKAVSDFCINIKERKNTDIEAVLLASLQTSTMEECVIPELNAGNTVIIDRWLPSYYAYQVISNGDPLADRLFNEYLHPRYDNRSSKMTNLYIYCYTDVEMSNHRIQNDTIREYAVFDYLDNLKKDVVIRGYDNFYYNFVGNKMILDTRFLSINAIKRILRDIIDESGLAQSPKPEGLKSIGEYLQEIGQEETKEPTQPEQIKTPSDKSQGLNDIFMRHFAKIGSEHPELGNENAKLTFPELDDLSFNKGDMQYSDKSVSQDDILRQLVASKDMEIMKECMAKLTNNGCGDDQDAFGQSVDMATSPTIESIHKTISDASKILDVRIEIANTNEDRDKKIQEGMAILEKGMRGLYQKNSTFNRVPQHESYTKLVPIVGQDLIDLIINQKVIKNPIKDFANLRAKTYDKKILTEIDVRLSGFIRRERLRASHYDSRHHYATEDNWNSLFTEEYHGAEFVAEKNKAYVKLDPGEMILGKTVELFQLPSDVIAEFSLRSWAARSGINQSTSLLMKPNWGGQLVLELHNALRTRIVHLEKGAVIGQVMFFKLEK